MEANVVKRPELFETDSVSEGQIRPIDGNLTIASDLSDLKCHLLDIWLFRL